MTIAAHVPPMVQFLDWYFPWGLSISVGAALALFLIEI